MSKRSKRDGKCQLNANNNMNDNKTAVLTDMFTSQAGMVLGKKHVIVIWFGLSLLVRRGVPLLQKNNIIMKGFFDHNS